MTWFNYYGLIIVAIILAPNIVYALKNKGIVPQRNGKIIGIIEQIGRYGSTVFMIFNIPYTYVGFYFGMAKAVYLAVDGALVLAYIIIWIITWKKNGIGKAVLLSVLPSLIFLFSGIMLGSIPLCVFAVVFAAAHITISIKNVSDGEKKVKKGIITAVALTLSLVFLGIAVSGGIIGYRLGSLNKLDDMSALDMIKYDCEEKGAIISIAIIENGVTNYYTYGNEEFSFEYEERLFDYEIGSISKTFVALLTEKAIKEGKISLDDSIAKYLELEGNKYYPTIRRLLTHTSGYNGYYFESRMISNKLSRVSNDYYGIDRTAILNKVKAINLNDEDYPFVYSNFGIAVMGLVLEKVYNADFTDVMNAYIRDELGLTGTEVAKKGGNLHNYWDWKANDGYIPAGAIISNIEDMTKYLGIYMNDGTDHAADVIAKQKDVSATDATYAKMNIRTDAVGLTWMLDEENGIIWHNGGTGNYNSYIGFTRDKTRGVVILSNLAPDTRISVTVVGAKILTGGGL